MNYFKLVDKKLLLAKSLGMALTVSFSMIIVDLVLYSKPIVECLKDFAIGVPAAFVFFLVFYCLKMTYEVSQKMENS